MSYYDLPTVLKHKFIYVINHSNRYPADFPIVIKHGVFIYTFWDFDLPVEKYRAYGHNYL